MDYVKKTAEIGKAKVQGTANKAYDSAEENLNVAADKVKGASNQAANSAA